MVKIKIKYVVEKYKSGKLYRFWQPKKSYLIAGKWVKCPFKSLSLPNDDSWIMKAIALNDAFDKWRNGKIDHNRYYHQGTVGWLVGDYKKDERFTDLAESTQKLYNWNFPDILNVFGDIPVNKVTRKQAKEFYKGFKDTKRKKSQLIQIARVVFSYAVDEELITANPFEKLRIKKAAARDVVWSEDIQQVAKNAAIELKRPSLALAIQLGLDTGQRPADLRHLSRNRYVFNQELQRHTIRLKQLKTKKWVEVPVMDELAKMLDATPVESPVFLISEITGKPYSKDELCRGIRDVLNHADIGSDTQFRDLRRTAVVRLAEHGCTNAEIAAITGHSLENVDNILEVYLPRNTQMAANGIAKLEKGKKEGA